MPRLSIPFALTTFLIASSASFGALPPRQDKPAETPQPAPTTSSTKDTNSAYDPFHAQQDVEIGMYYLHKGDIDAAIGRFQDAIQLKSSFAKPRLLLAQAYEKKRDKTTALKYYREYLKVFPDAPDAKKIQSRIAKLSTSDESR